MSLSGEQPAQRPNHPTPEPLDAGSERIGSSAGVQSVVSRETAPSAAADAADAVDEDDSTATAPPERTNPDDSTARDGGAAPEVSRETALDAPPEPLSPAFPPLDPLEAGDLADAESASPPLPAHVAAALVETWAPPATSRILGVANQKGGVGKTTSTVNLAAALALHGARVLVVDLDPQGNASTAFGVEHRAGTPSIYDVLVDGQPIADVVVAAPDIPNLFCVPATIDLAGAEIELVSVVARESRLRRALTDAGDDYDYVFIDCPPSLGLLTVNALVATREVLIPIQCEFYALEGLSQLLRNIELIRSHLNPDLHVSTILLTMYDGRTRLAEQVAQEVRDHFGDLVVSATIPRSVRISEAPGYGQSVMTYDPASRGAVAYAEAAREIASRSARADDSTSAPDDETRSTE